MEDFKKHISKLLGFMYIMSVLIFFGSLGLAFIKLYYLFIGLIITVVLLFVTLTAEKAINALIKYLEEER